ncbi:MAG: type II toxin-antitoxin system RelE/ParE family toxin [Candidatus Electrothrix sp. AR5]|nr:type II toxin-antitoxin system RelE/ParE family toxin [Candidatus Electrothrix sp. AR5]
MTTFKTKNGKSPFAKWLEELDEKTALRIQERIRRIGLGNLGDYKSVGSGVYELRFFFKRSGGYRIYFGFKDRELIVLLCAGDKSTQAKDIRKAKEYWRKYEQYNGL